MNIHIVTNAEGKYLKSGSRIKWVNQIDDATLYTKEHIASARCAYFFKRYPQFGCPTIITMECKVIKTVDPREDILLRRIKTEKRNNKRALRDMESRRISIEQDIIEKKAELKELNEKINN